jgi:hypothetical protein
MEFSKDEGAGAGFEEGGARTIPAPAPRQIHVLADEQRQLDFQASAALAASILGARDRWNAAP